MTKEEFERWKIDKAMGPFIWPYARPEEDMWPEFKKQIPGSFVEPTRWQKLKNRLSWRWFHIREFIAIKILPEVKGWDERDY